MNENPLKLGVVGCGWAGRMAVDAGMTVPRTTVAAIAEPVEELRNQTVEEYGVTKTYTDYRQLLDDKEIEA
ncbi:MAG: Gfo/Idh/MocA family oxidoreductase, partial [Planctomycetota bacterium]|nr:Gfo/Idh/MocA family oxidoreductase [Planctomycetota bacterium]